MTTQDPIQEPEGFTGDTASLMSWAALQFIQRPSSRFLQWMVLAITVLSAAAAVASFLISVDIVVNASGEIVADPSVIQVVAPIDGLLANVRRQPGDRVAKNDILASFQMDLGEEEIAKTLKRLQANIPLVEGATRRRGAPKDVDLVNGVVVIQDGAIMEAQTSLQSAWRDLEQSLSGLGEYERDKNTFIRLNRVLEGRLSAYLEKHLIRAPADGTIAAVHSSVNSSVRSGSVLASILPEGATLVAWFEVSSRDIPSVRAGERVMHRVDAFPFHRFGSFDGQVKSIEQVLADTATGNSTGLGRSVKYFVRSTIVPSRNVAFALSMKVQSRIVTGRKKLKDLLFDSWFGGRQSS